MMWCFLWVLPCIPKTQRDQRIIIYPDRYSAGERARVEQVLEQQHRAQLAHNKTERQIRGENARRRSPLWQQDLHATVWVPREHFVRCFSLVGLALVALGLVAVIGSHDCALVQIQCVFHHRRRSLSL